MPPSSSKLILKANRAVKLFEQAVHEVLREGLRLDMVLFDVDGVIARRLAVDAAPLAAGKTSVRVFGISNLACDNIGRVLLNDILVCQDATGDRTDCMDHVVPDSIAGVPFIK